MPNEQTPQSYDGSRISPEIRGQLGNLTPELAKGIRNVADAPPTPDKPKGK